ncbi:MAG: hypothetical protein WD397_14735 [Wenzhouxiangellaceae bacterium]
MNKSEQKRFDELYRKHLRPLKLQGMSDKTFKELCGCPGTLVSDRESQVENH